MARLCHGPRSCYRGEVSRSRWLSGVLWSTTITATACGRLGFDEPRTTSAPVASVNALLETTSECGILTPPGVDLVIKNLGDEDLEVLEATPTGGFAVDAVLPLVIAPGDEVRVAVRPPAAVIGTDRGGDIRSGQLTLVTNDPAATETVVELQTTILGATIAVTDLAMQPVTLTFVSATGACPAPQLVKLINLGNLPVTVDNAGGTGLATGFSTVSLDPGSNTTINVRPETNNACSFTGQLTYTVTGSVCSATPGVLMASVNITGASSCVCS